MPDGMGLPPVGVPGAPGLPLAQHVQPAQAAGKVFREVLLERLDQVNGLQKETEAVVSGLTSGELKGVNEVLVAVQKAEVAYQTLMQIRGKLFEAYEEISRLRI